MSNTSTSIPIFRSGSIASQSATTKSTPSSGFSPIVTDNIVSEIDSIARSAIQNEQQVIKMKLENDLFQYKQLGYDTINNAFQKNQDNPEGLQTSLDGARKSLLSGVPFALRQQADEWFYGTSQAYLSKSRSNETAKLTDQLKANTFSNLKNISNSINLSAENLFSADASLNAQASITLFEKLGEGIESLNTTLPDGSPIFSEVDKFKIMEDLKENVMTTGMQRQFDSLKTIEEKQTFLDHFKNNELAIPYKSIGGQEEKINVAEAVGFQGYDKNIRYMQQSIVAQAKQDEKNIGANYLKAVLSGDALPDPARKDYSDAVNSFYEETMRPVIQGLNPQEKSNVMLNYMSSTQVIPSMILREVKAWNDSQNVNDLKTASNFIIAAQEQFPQFLDKLSDKDYGKALAVSEKIVAGANADEVIRAVNQLYSPVTGEIFQQRSREFTSITKDKGIDFEKKAEQALGGFFTSGVFRPRFNKDTITGPEAALQYKRIWQTNYELTGDFDKAEEIAKERIKRLYGTSSVNDGKVMYLPPENFAYNIPNADSKWMKEQLIEDGKTEIERLGLKVDPSTLFLYSDRQSLREADANGLPSYQVMGRNEAGNIVTINDIGNEPMRWFPDTEKQRSILQTQRIGNYLERADIISGSVSSKMNLARTLIPFLFINPQTENIKKVYNNINKTLTDMSNKSPIQFNSNMGIIFPSVSAETIKKESDKLINNIIKANQKRDFQ